jgi:glycosyltransferase involved in cell wall biosynthesis
MTALASQPFVRAAWGAGGVEIPGSWAPGILILHRQFMDSPNFIKAIEGRIARGWVIVSEIDDDPHHWPQYVNSDFRAFRGVHAVTVTTEPLARMIRQWNPHVEILPNAASYLPAASDTSPKAGDRVRVFFGALNREKDGGEIVRALSATALELGDRVEFVVVHDRAFFDSLPAGIRKSFSPTLAFDAYMALLASCDIALLPLQDTSFNRLKSDLKFVESCAAGVVPICSETVYGAEARHRDIGIFAHTPADWAEALRLLVEDPDALARRRAAGAAYVRERRMHADQAAVREDLYRRLLRDRTALEAERQARLAKHFG